MSQSRLKFKHYGLFLNNVRGVHDFATTNVEILHYLFSNEIMNDVGLSYDSTTTSV